MEDAYVSIQKIAGYEKGDIRRSLHACLSRLEELTAILQPGLNVFVKINHLSPPSLPEQAIITHPLFTRAVLLILKDFGCQVIVGDDIYSKDHDGFIVSGYRQICEELKIPLVNLKEKGFREVLCHGEVIKKTFISSLVLDSDLIVNIPKLKTHSFTVFTGAVKNMYGIIPHGLRLSYHRQFPSNEVFSRMIVDIFSCAPPNLNILDGITGMEGEGPSAGAPKNVGLILASTDAVALDTVAAEIIGLSPKKVTTIENAHERGLGVGEIEKITTLGFDIQSVRVKDFKQSSIAVGLIRKKIPAFLHAFIQNQFVLIPEVIKKKCTACKECVDICPAGAVSLCDDKARIDKSLCIHCMCCHEVCRFHAIRLKQKILGGLTRRTASLYKQIKAFLT